MSSTPLSSFVAVVVCVGATLGCAESTHTTDAGTACVPNPCAHGGICELSSGVPSCLCSGGFAGPTCVLCATGNVGENCDECATDYQDNDGDGICSERCTPLRCSGNGVCSDQSGTATCDCDSTSMGDFCTEPAGTVTIPESGLEWQIGVGPGPYNWESADAYCRDLVLNAEGDWRLPTRMELASLFDFENQWFPRSVTGVDSWDLERWTSTVWQHPSDMAWYAWTVGQLGVNRKSQTEQRAVTCVRGDSGPSTPALTNNGDGTVTDANTGLVWDVAGSPEGGSSAWSYCAGLDLGGFPIGSWRMPTILEMLTIVDETFASSYAIDQQVFPTGHLVFWSSTSMTYFPTKYWRMSYVLGDATYQEQNAFAHYVRCVR